MDLIDISSIHKNKLSFNKYQYMFLGIVFGLCFSLLAVVIEMIIYKANFLFAVTGKTNELMYIVNLAPIVLGVIFFILGWKQEKISELLTAYKTETVFYKNAIDQTAIVAVTDVSGKIIYVNDTFCKISEYSREELIGQNHRLLKSSVMTDSFFKDMWKTISSGEIWRGEICNRTKNQKLYWVDTTIIPEKNEAGRIFRYTSVRYDITRRKQAEQNLWTVSEMQRAVLAGAHYSIISTDKKGIIQTFNPAAERMLGYSAEEIVGKHSPAIIHRFDEVVKRAEMLTQELGKKIEPGFEVFVAKALLVGADENEWTYVRKDGSTFPVELSVTAIYSKQGELVGFVGLARDITERKTMAAELIRSKDAAIAAAKIKSMFLATMSHEIRTPMNGIIGMTNLLFSDIKEPKQIEKLKVIQNCGNNLLDLVNDILDFSKLEMGKLDLESEPFSLHAAVREIIDLLSPRAQEKNIDLYYHPDKSVPSWIKGDITRFRQVITNLLSNAIKFTDRGSVSVSAHGQLLEKGIYEILFSVKDTGIGIADDVKSKLFQSFSQVDASTTRKFGGTGLGLAITKGICEKMGGTVWVESEIGKGSVFKFTFKVAASKEPIVENQWCNNNPFAKVDAEMGRKKPLKILIAEDNRVNQMVFLGLLSKLGYQADVAGNGVEVLESLSMKDYDIVFMDCHMPVMDGFEASKNINEQYKNENYKYKNPPKVIAVTASTMKEDVEKCYASGMSGFIGKPITISEIIKSLETYNKDIQEYQKTEVSLPPAKDIMKIKKESFDKNLFISQFKGIEDIAKQMIESFLENLSNMENSIDQALVKENLLDLEHFSHALKGALSNFYAEPAKTLAWQLEKSARDHIKGNIQCDNDFEQFRKINGQMKEELRNLEEDLKKILSKNLL